MRRAVAEAVAVLLYLAVPSLALGGGSARSATSDTNVDAKSPASPLSGAVRFGDAIADLATRQASQEAVLRGERARAASLAGEAEELRAHLRGSQRSETQLRRAATLSDEVAAATRSRCKRKVDAVLRSSRNRTQELQRSIQTCKAARARLDGQLNTTRQHYENALNATSVALLREGQDLKTLTLALGAERKRRGVAETRAALLEQQLDEAMKAGAEVQKALAAARVERDAAQQELRELRPAAKEKDALRAELNATRTEEAKLSEHGVAAVHALLDTLGKDERALLAEGRDLERTRLQLHAALGEVDELLAQRVRLRATVEGLRGAGLEAARSELGKAAGELHGVGSALGAGSKALGVARQTLADGATREVKELSATRAKLDKAVLEFREAEVQQLGVLSERLGAAQIKQQKAQEELQARDLELNATRGRLHLALDVASDLQRRRTSELAMEKKARDGLVAALRGEVAEVERLNRTTSERKSKELGSARDQAQIEVYHRELTRAEAELAKARQEISNLRRVLAADDRGLVPAHSRLVPESVASR
mmetsp:Transcript_53375/g.114725  ORF Transcript_53375/g.114725 Transcript_53375/m.114725 type:complete len:544 (+) Transcript_53375:110-1741(+)